MKAEVDADTCPRCGALMALVRRIVAWPVNRTTVRVPQTLHYRCPQCDEMVFTLEQARLVREKAFARYRTLHKLLSPAEVAGIRTRHRLSAERMAAVLRTEPRLIERWEEGQLVQTPQADSLLRILRDVPGTLRLLKKFAA